MSKKIIKHELFEVLIPKGTTLTQFPIPDLPNLREVELWGVQAYYNDVIPNSVISQKTVVPKNVFVSSFLTLVNYAGREFLKQAPLVLFQTIETNMVGVPISTDPLIQIPFGIQEKDFKSFCGQKVNYSKSYINVSIPVSIAVIDYVFLISIYYVDPKEMGKDQTTFREKH